MGGGGVGVGGWGVWGVGGGGGGVGVGVWGCGGVWGGGCSPALMCPMVQLPSDAYIMSLNLFQIVQSYALIYEF